MKKKLLLLLIVSIGLLYMKGRSKSQRPELPQAKMVGAATSQAKPQADPEILAMAQKLQAALDRAAQAQNADSKP